VVLGRNPGLGDADELVLRPQAVVNAAGDGARAHIPFQAANDGVLMLSEAVLYPDWFRLAADVDYALRAEAHNVVLATLDSAVGPVHQHVSGSAGNDYFYATHSDALRGPGERKLTLDGGDGRDVLTARLDQKLDYSVQAPTISNIERMELMAVAPSAGEAGLKFTHISGVEEVWNQSPALALTLIDLREQLRLGAVSAGSATADGVDYIARYGEGVTLPEVQEVALDHANLGRLGITGLDGDLQAASAGIELLEIQLRGNNRIASFTEDSNQGYNLSDSLKVIGLTRLDHAAADEYLLLELKEVWGGLTIDMSALKSGGGGALSLQEATVSGALTVTLAELAHETWGDKGDVGDGSPGNRKSEMGIVLPRLDALDGAAITLQNLTVASTGAYTHAPQENDIIALTSWNLADAAALAGLVSSIRIPEGAGLSAESGGLNYVNVAVEFDCNDDSVTDFTLTLENLVSAQVYNTMLAALDTVNAHDELKSTLDLIGSGIEIEAGALHGAFKFSSADVVIERGAAPEGADAILGLVGILVDERTIFLQEA